jgi:hypothetical protein
MTSSPEPLSYKIHKNIPEDINLSIPHPAPLGLL